LAGAGSCKDPSLGVLDEAEDSAPLPQDDCKVGWDSIVRARTPAPTLVQFYCNKSYCRRSRVLQVRVMVSRSSGVKSVNSNP
jgi:hypothetical protein